MGSTTMELEQQVCSLELAKKLKELEVKQEGYWFWVDTGLNEPILQCAGCMENAVDYYRDGDFVATAFTVAELGEMLHGAKSDLMISTVDLDVDGVDHLWSVAKIAKVEHIQARSAKHQAGIYELHHLDHVEAEVTEANARAKMLIYLIEHKLITT